jgi:hypothetical protein
MGTFKFLKGMESFKGVCPPNWIKSPIGFFPPYYLKDVFQNDGFKV